MTDFAELMTCIDRIADGSGRCGKEQTMVAAAARLVEVGEAVLSQWVAARGVAPTREAREGFRLLALQRQGATGDPSFNACRETCREIAYHYNLIQGAPGDEQVSARLEMMCFVTRHLLLFVQGKLEDAGLGDFCCAARPVRGSESF